MRIRMRPLNLHRALMTSRPQQRSVGDRGEAKVPSYPKHETPGPTERRPSSWDRANQRVS